VGRPGSEWGQMASYFNTAMNLRFRHSVKNFLTAVEIYASQEGLCSMDFVR